MLKDMEWLNICNNTPKCVFVLKKTYKWKTISVITFWILQFWKMWPPLFFKWGIGPSYQNKSFFPLRLASILEPILIKNHGERVKIVPIWLRHYMHYMNSEDQDQLAHLYSRSIFKVFSVHRYSLQYMLNKILHQTVRLCRLIRIFVVRI